MKKTNRQRKGCFYPHKIIHHCPSKVFEFVCCLSINVRNWKKSARGFKTPRMKWSCVSVVSAGTGGLKQGELFRNNTSKYDRLYLQSRGAYTLYMHPNLPVLQVNVQKSPEIFRKKLRCIAIGAVQLHANFTVQERFWEMKTYLACKFAGTGGFEVKAWDIFGNEDVSCMHMCWYRRF